MTGDTQGVLDKMASQILERKRTAGAKLTPVGLELTGIAAGDFAMRSLGVDPASPFPAYVPGAVFPNDTPVQEIVGAIREIRRQVAGLNEALFAIEAAVIGDEAARENALTIWAGYKTPAVDMKREAERLADKRAKAALRGSTGVVEASAVVPINAEPDVVIDEAGTMPVAEFVDAVGDMKAAIRHRLEGEAQRTGVYDGAAINAEVTAATFVPTFVATNIKIIEADGTVGWVCHIHGTYRDAVTRKGRQARRCADETCDQWEVLA